MKKKLLIVLSIILVLALCCSLLAACNDDEEPDNPENPSGSNLKPGDSFVDEKDVTNGTYEWDGDKLVSSSTWTEKQITVQYLLGEESYVVLEGNKPSQMALTHFVGHIDSFALSDVETNLTINEEPVSVVAIGPGAFAANSYIRNVDLTKVNDALNFNIMDGAFTNCSNLESVTLPEKAYTNFNVIGQYAFSNCISLQSIEVNDKFSEIGAGAFAFCSNLSSVELTDNITVIPQSAFAGCTSLTSFDFPKNLTRIETLAFTSSGLHSVNVPDTVEYIGSQAFANIDNLSSISLPFVGNTIVDTEHGLANIIGRVRSGLSMNDLDVTVRTAQTLVAGSHGIFDDLENAGIRSITVQKFADPGLYNVYDESSGLYQPRELNPASIVKKITSGAFEDFADLERVSLPEGITSIGNRAFKGCESLESFVIPDTVLTVGDSAFEGCHELESITFPASVYSVGNKALADCWNLQSLTVEKNYQPFATDEEGNSLMRAQLAVDNVSKLFEEFNDAYSYSGSLYVTYDDANNLYTTGAYHNGEAYLIPRTLKTVTINNTDYIDDYEFNGWQYLETFNWTLSENYYSGNSDQNKVGDYAFYGCTNLKAFTIPGDRKASQEYDETLPGINKIGSHAFENCRALTSITFPASVDTIGASALAYCDHLTSVTFDALQKCTYDFDHTETVLTGYTLSSASTSGLYNLFATSFDADEYEPVPYAYSDTMYSANDTAPTGNNNNLTLYPNSLKTVTVNGVNNLPNNFFKGMKELTTVTLGQLTFEHEDKIQTNSFDNPVFTAPLKVIGDYAFAGCAKLTGVDINGFNWIGNYAFQGNNLGPNVTIPNSVQFVGNHIYDNCPNIAQLKIDDYSNLYYTTGITSNYTGNTSSSKPSQSSHVNIKNLFTYSVANYSDVADYQYLSSTQYVPVKLTKVILDEVAELSDIASGCFTNMVNLEEVELNTASEQPKYWVINSSVASNLSGGFDGCINLTKLTSNAEAVYSESVFTSNWEFDCGSTKFYEHKLPDGTTIVTDYQTYWYLKEEQGDDDETVQVPTAYNFDQHEEEISYVFHDVEGGKQADGPVTVTKAVGENGVLQESDQPKDWTHDDVAEKKQVLLGWSTSSSASSVNVTFPYYSTTNVNLYAVWGEEEAPDTKVEVTNVTNDYLTFTSERTIAFNGAYMVVDFNKYSDTTTWEVTFKITAKAACTVSFNYMFRANGSNGSVTCRYNIYKDGVSQTGSYHSVSSSTSWSSLSSTQLDEGGYIEFRVSVPREYTPTASTELWLSNIVVVPTVVTD